MAKEFIQEIVSIDDADRVKELCMMAGSLYDEGFLTFHEYSLIVSVAREFFGDIVEEVSE